MIQNKILTAGLAATILTALVIFSCKPQKPLLLLVSPDGKAVHGYDGVFPSLAQAMEASKEAPEAVIYLDEGIYFLDSTLRLNQRRNLTITSKALIKPLVYGGKPLTNWTWDGPFMVADASGEEFRVLEVNGRFAPRARYPEQGTLLHESTFDSEWLSTLEGGFSPQPTDSQLVHMTLKPGDLGRFGDLTNGEITLYHMWDETLVRVKSIERENRTLLLANKPAYPAGAFGVYKYVVWNVPEGMTQPGQWYFDRKMGKVYYWPLEGETPQNITAIIPTLDTLISVTDGRNITISNIGFRINHAPLMVGGFGAKWFAGAVTVDQSESVRLENLEFANLTTMAIKAISCQDVDIRNNLIRDTGAGGIRLIGSNSRISGNRLLHTGRIYPSAIALYVNVTDPNAKEEWEMGKSHGNILIDQNEICDAPYVAIACGGHDSRITHNRVHRVMQVLSDGGGIYVTFCANLMLSGNHVYDIPKQEGYGTCAYYLDELTSNALVENNLSQNVARAMHNHLSENNTIRNNVFVNEEGELRITFHRCKDFELTGNVFMAGETIEVKGLNVVTRGGNNFLHSLEGKRIFGSVVTQYEKLSEGPVTDNAFFVLENPGIQSIREGKVLLDAGSPLPARGISPLDVSGAGVHE